jgi:hypothetical protein
MKLGLSIIAFIAFAAAAAAPRRGVPLRFAFGDGRGFSIESSESAGVGRPRPRLVGVCDFIPGDVGGVLPFSVATPFGGRPRFNGDDAGDFFEETLDATIASAIHELTRRVFPRRVDEEADRARACACERARTTSRTACRV